MKLIEEKQVSWLSQRMRNNIGSHDRFLRSLLGAALVLVAWLFQLPEAFWLGLFLILTAALRFCPSYAIFNVNTLNADDGKTVIPWEEFLDLLPPSAPASSVAAPPSTETRVKAPPSLAPVSFRLPPDLTQALIQDIEKNALDEILMVRFFENFFGCKISIQSAAHLNIYVCQFPDKTTRLDFSKMKANLLQRLHETAH